MQAILDTTGCRFSVLWLENSFVFVNGFDLFCGLFGIMFNCDHAF